MGFMDKISGLVDKGQGYAAEAVVMALQPRVHSEIDSRVDAFREATLNELPRQCEDGLRNKADNSTVAWAMSKVLGDNTDVLVAKLVERFRPGITTSTDGLSSTATEYILAQLKDLLDGSSSEAAAAAAAAAAAPTAEGVTQQVEQLQVQEQVSRDIDLSAAEPAAAPEGAAADGESSEGGFRSKLLAGVTALAGVAFGVDDKLPAFEDAARSLVHPLFETLKAQVWQLVPDTLQDVLGDLVGDKQDDVESGEAGVPEGEQSGGWRGWVQSKLEGKAGVVLDKLVAATLDAIDGPMQALIGRLVDDCESASLSAAFLEVRQKLAEYKLISADTAAQV